MKAKDVYLKTMKFVWLKLALGGAIFLFAFLTMFLFIWLGSLGGGSGIVMALTIWFVLVGAVYGLVQRYVGYMIKAGHVAMVTTAVTTLIVMGVSFVAWLLPFLVFAGIFALLHIHWIFAFMLALMAAAIIKSAFVDSYMMVKMMVSYMQVAPSTEITFDLYDKLCRLSGKFKSLFTKGQEEQQQYGNAQM